MNILGKMLNSIIILRALIKKFLKNLLEFTKLLFMIFFYPYIHFIGRSIAYDHPLLYIFLYDLLRALRGLVKKEYL